LKAQAINATTLANNAAIEAAARLKEVELAAANTLLRFLREKRKKKL
jgi:hypothetical protein